MALLTRYKKSGGFLQLLQLIETCTEHKKVTLLVNIEKEDSRWAKMIKDKMLTLDEIFKWDKVLLGEIFQSLQELTLAICMHNFTDEQKEVALHTHSHMKKRNILDLAETKNPSPGEIHTALSKIIEETRQLITTGHIKVKEIAPHLYIETDIEHKIDEMPYNIKDENQETENPFAESKVDPSTLNFDGLKSLHKTDTPTPSEPENSSQLLLLKNEVHRLKKENLDLKKEVNDLRIKMTQMKNILAA